MNTCDEQSMIGRKKAQKAQKQTLGSIPKGHREIFSRAFAPWGKLGGYFLCLLQFFPANPVFNHDHR
jgi:hypothetical protein